MRNNSFFPSRRMATSARAAVIKGLSQTLLRIVAVECLSFATKSYLLLVAVVATTNKVGSLFKDTCICAMEKERGVENERKKRLVKPSLRGTTGWNQSSWFYVYVCYRGGSNKEKTLGWKQQFRQYALSMELQLGRKEEKTRRALSI